MAIKVWVRVRLCVCVKTNLLFPPYPDVSGHVWHTLEIATCAGNILDTQPRLCLGSVCIVLVFHMMYRAYLEHDILLCVII